jgi:hypothetical protein
VKIPLEGTAGKQLVTDMRILCDKIVSGEITGEPVSAKLGTQTINVLAASCGLAGIWYDPRSIKVAK